MNSWATTGSIGQSNSAARQVRENELNKRHLEREKRQKKNLDTRDLCERRTRTVLTSDPEASDMLLSLFSASLFSLRRNTVCEPFPIMFTKDTEKEFDDLQHYMQVLPDVRHLSHAQSLGNLKVPMLYMLNWIIDSRIEGFRFRKISLEEYKSETAGIDAKQNKFSDPNHIFKVEYEDDHPSLQKWNEMKEKYGVTLGFHGSAFENFHSILRNGLDNYFGKETSLYGEGIYLSEDRDVAFSFLKFGKNFYKNTKFGDHLGCIACGEVIKHPKHVRISDEKKDSSGGIQISAAHTKLPKGYIVVENNDYVQVKYLLVYENFVTKKQKTNICHTIVIVYFVLLIALVIYKSSYWNYYLRYLN